MTRLLTGHRHLTLQRGVTGPARIAKTSHRGVTGSARMLHGLTHSTLSRQHREKMQSDCFVRVREGAGFLMVWETVPRNYFFIFFSPLEIWVFFLQSLIAQTALYVSLTRK